MDSKPNRYQIIWMSAGLLAVLTLLLIIEINEHDIVCLLPNSSEMKMITNDEFSFSLHYPLEWQIHYYGLDGDDQLESLRLKIKDQSPNEAGIYVIQSQLVDQSQSAAADWSLHQFWVNRTQQGELIQVEINSTLAYKRVYSFNQLKFEVLSMARPDDMLAVRLQVREKCYEEYQPLFNEIIASFESWE